MLLGYKLQRGSLDVFTRDTTLATQNRIVYVDYLCNTLQKERKGKEKTRGEHGMYILEYNDLRMQFQVFFGV